MLRVIGEDSCEGSRFAGTNPIPGEYRRERPFRNQEYIVLPMLVGAVTSGRAQNQRLLI